MQVENLRYLIQQVPDGIHGGARLSPTKKVGRPSAPCLKVTILAASRTGSPSGTVYVQGFTAGVGGAKPVLNIEARWHGEGYFDQTEESSKFRQVIIFQDHSTVNVMNAVGHMPASVIMLCHVHLNRSGRSARPGRIRPSVTLSRALAHWGSWQQRWERIWTTRTSWSMPSAKKCGAAP